MVRLRKKGGMYWEHWAEIYAVMFGILGFLIAIAISSFWWSILIILISGAIAGRLVADAKLKGMFPYWLIGFGMMIGMMIGTRPLRWYNVFLLFQIGWYVGWKLHQKGYFT